jgi:hypothetical protein
MTRRSLTDQTCRPADAWRSMLAAAALAALPLAAEAQDGGDWTYNMSLYLWGAGQEGTTTVADGFPPADVELSFGDILDALDFATFAAGNANNGRFGLTVDLGYVNTGASADTPGTAFGGAEIDTETTFLTVTGEYLVASTPRSKLWASGGLRYWDVSTDIDFSAGTSAATSVGSGDSWVDPVLGLRGTADLSENSYMTGWFYGGGFGAGSEEMYDVFGGLGYRFTPRTNGIVGYRYYSVDREDGEFAYDVSQQGPILGVVFGF